MDGFLQWWVSPTNHGFFLLKMDVSANRHTPKSSILIGFSIINHPFWGTPIFGDTQMIILGCEMRYHHLRKHPHSWQTSFPQANIAHENRPLPTGTCHFATIKFRVLSQCHREGKKLTQQCFGKKKLAIGWWQNHHTLFLMSSKKLQGEFWAKIRNPMRV